MVNYKASEADKIWKLLNEAQWRMEQMKGAEQEHQWNHQEHKKWDLAYESEERLLALRDAIAAVETAMECVEGLED